MIFRGGRTGAKTIGFPRASAFCQGYAMSTTLNAPEGHSAGPRPGGCWRPTACRLVIYTTVLFASFHANALGIRSGLLWYQTEPRSGYQDRKSVV